VTGKLAGCPLCDAAGGRLVVQGASWRLVHAAEPGFPAFYRLVWQEHVREFSQVARADRIACMDALVAIEDAMLRHLRPAKVNLASLGNAVPHLHWHVVARFDWDSHFPGAVWAQPQRAADPGKLQELAGRLPALEEEFRKLLTTGG
jgi:diadenosine tetraphosphate (Ap4A) HIT family hydrolase